MFLSIWCVCHDLWSVKQTDFGVIVNDARYGWIEFERIYDNFLKDCVSTEKTKNGIAWYRCDVNKNIR